MLTAPCKDCPNRILGCHSSCEKYKNFQSSNNELNQSKCSANNTKYDYLEHMKLSKRRMRENQGNLRQSRK